MTMARLAVAVLAGMWVHSFAPPAMAQATANTAAQNEAAATMAPKPRRPRPQVRVYPYPQPPFWEYPRPGTYSWPGPYAKRDCRVRYVIENRPSGAVMTPRMRCEWVPG